MERWKPIAGLEDRYEVSDHGRVRSLPRVFIRSNGVSQTVRGKIIAQRECSSKCGRRMISLNSKGGRLHKLVHRLVAEAFCEKFIGCDVVNHLDNNPANNCRENLEWTTIEGNNQYMFSQGRGKVPTGQIGSKSPTAKHTEGQAVAVIQELKNSDKTHRQIAQDLGVTKSFVSEISTGRSWSHVPRN
jgi:hypothetical protein